MTKRLIALNISKPVHQVILKKSIELLENKGYKTTIMQAECRGAFMGSAEDRKRLLKESIDCENKVIIIISGGMGCLDVLEDIDYNKIIAKEKLFVGMSGNTALLNAIYKKTGKTMLLCTNMYGISQDKTGKTLESLSRFLETGKDTIDNVDIIHLPDRKTAEVKGKIIGGNLRFIETLIGTKYEPEWDDKILFIEEKDRGMGDLIRAYHHFKQAGILNRVKGIVIGHIKASIDKEKEEYLYELLQEENIIVIKTEAFGHNCPNAAIPIGGTAKIDVKNKKIVMQSL